jgi:hypothetical protein
VLVDGLVPAGSLGVEEQVDVPILGLSDEVADRLRELLAGGVPVELAVGAASTGANPELAVTAPFSSTGLALAGGTKPELAAAGVGLATSVPGEPDDDETALYGTISGSSAAAALVAGAAALLAQARPDLDAAGLHGALVAGARRRLGRAGTPIGTVDPQSSSAVELVATPPSVSVAPLGPGRSSGTGTVTLMNVSRRPLSFRIVPAAAPPGVVVRLSRGSLSLAPGASKAIQVAVRASGLPTPPAALSGTLRAVVRRGGTLRIPWAAPVPVAKRPVIGDVALSATTFAPDDDDPVVLSFVAGRVDGSPNRPQLLPLARLQVELYRGGRRLGALVTLRTLLPGRYALGLTGRGPGGGRLPSGPYSLRIIGSPVGGGVPTTVDVPFRIR